MPAEINEGKIDFDKTKNLTIKVTGKNEEKEFTHTIIIKSGSITTKTKEGEEDVSIIEQKPKSIEIKSKEIKLIAEKITFQTAVAAAGEFTTEEESSIVMEKTASENGGIKLTSKKKYTVAAETDVSIKSKLKGVTIAASEAEAVKLSGKTVEGEALEEVKLSGTEKVTISGKAEVNISSDGKVSLSGGKVGTLALSADSSGLEGAGVSVKAVESVSIEGAMSVSIKGLSASVEAPSVSL